MQNPLVTIITPTFNHAMYISACLESAIEQTYSNWEMLVMNDGSSDDTVAIVESYCKKDSRIKLFSQENIGIMRLAETYNKAVSLASGTYLTILEGDDLINPDKLEKQVAMLEQDDDMVMCWSKANSVSGDGTQILDTYPKITGAKKHHFENKPVGDFLNILFFENPIPAVSMMIRKDAIIKIGGFAQSHNLPLVDLPTIFKLSTIGCFGYIDSPLAKWRVYANQITKTYTLEILKGRIALCLESYESLNEDMRKTLDFNRAFLQQYYNSLFLVSYARSGRYKLIRKDFAGARADYLKAMFHRSSVNLTWRLRAFVGFVFSLFRADVEGLSRLLGKKTYNS